MPPLCKTPRLNRLEKDRQLLKLHNIRESSVKLMRPREIYTLRTGCSCIPCNRDNCRTCKNCLDNMYAPKDKRKRKRCVYRKCTKSPNADNDANEYKHDYFDVASGLTTMQTCSAKYARDKEEMIEDIEEPINDFNNYNRDILPISYVKKKVEALIRHGDFLVEFGNKKIEKVQSMLQKLQGQGPKTAEKWTPLLITLPEQYAKEQKEIADIRTWLTEYLEQYAEIFDEKNW